MAGLRTRDSSKDFNNPLVIAYYTVDYQKNPKGTNYWRNRVLKVAKEWAGKINFAISSKDDFQHELNEYGYDYVGDKPLILARDAQNQKFIMKDEFSWVAFSYLLCLRDFILSIGPHSIENLSAFVADLEEGSLEAYVKSEPVPESNDGPVIIAVGKNYEEVVTKNDKDILIEFYAPWCGKCHCQKPRQKCC